MYSICVQKHIHKYGSTILIGVRQDGIHESLTGNSLRLHPKEIDALSDFGHRAEAIRLATYGKKENEIL
jgi:hypothetical protein